jgi:hypothetical protein
MFIGIKAAAGHTMSTASWKAPVAHAAHQALTQTKHAARAHETVGGTQVRLVTGAVWELPAAPIITVVNHDSHARS